MPSFGIPDLSPELEADLVSPFPSVGSLSWQLFVHFRGERFLMGDVHTPQHQLPLHRHFLDAVARLL